MNQKLLVVAAVSVALVGCKKAKKEDTPATSAGSAAPAAAAPVDQDSLAARKPGIPEAKLQAFVQTWLAAQNEGKFEAYEALYAAKFSGIKRVGPKTFRFAREGWLADRKKMFKHKMSVEASELVFSPAERTADITFVQRWASGKFEDLGPKRLMVVLEGDALKIAQEEMLRSEVADPGAWPKVLQDFYLLYEDHLVLADVEVPDPRGALSLRGVDPYVVEAAVAADQLPEEVRALKGQKFRTDIGCVASVTGFRMMSRLTPHFVDEQIWACEFGEDDDCVVATEAERAAHVWSSGKQYVLAELDGCGGRAYAQRADSPPSFVAGEVVADPGLLAMAIDAFGKLDAVTSQRDEDLGEGDGTPRGDGRWWASLETAQIFRHPGSGQVLVSVYADNGGTCGEFSASAWQLWVVENGKLMPLAFGSAPNEILDAVDVNGDGTLELVTTGSSFGDDLVLIDSAKLEQLVTFVHRYAECPC